MKLRCPQCDKYFSRPAGESSAKPEHYPFCCERCKLIDLGAWLDSDYKIISKYEDEEPLED